VLLLSEDGIVGFEAVFLEKSFVALGLDVCEFIDVSIGTTELNSFVRSLLFGFDHLRRGY
jgi:hypothetical protein